MNTEQEDLNRFHIARQQLDRAVQFLPDFKKGLIDFLKSPARSITLCFPVEMDDGFGADLYGVSRPSQPDPWTGKRRHPVSP